MSGPSGRYLQFVELIVRDYKVFIDTCSLCTKGFAEFSKTFFPLLRKCNSKLIVPLRVVDELKRLTLRQDTEENVGTQERAQYAYKVLVYYQNEGLVTLHGEDGDNFADNVFLVQFTKFRIKHKLALITQDRGLATDISRLNDSNSVDGQVIKALRITDKGFLGKNLGVNYQYNDTTSNVNSKKKNSIGSQVGGVDEHEDMESSKKFSIKKKITNLDDFVIPTAHFPGPEETVTTLMYGDVTLRPDPKRGGEGSVFLTDKPGLVCKIYHQDKLTRHRLEKLRLMVDCGINKPGICWPIDAVLNREGKPVGYLMPEAKGTELQRSLFIPPLMKKNFPAWKRIDIVELAINIMEKINYLHSQNIIVGDINPSNILINEDKKVYFVDTDSYQIEEFPCPVGTITFTAPEIQRKPFSEFLRSVGNERFALATLLFMLMLPGKNPYAQQGGANLIDNIIEMDFSYPFGSKSNKKTPDGPWRFCWSHLPYNIKEHFYETFRKGGKISTENTRISTSNWLSLFQEYHYLLKSGKFGEQDPMSEEIFPTRFKQIKGMSYQKCRLCKQDFPEEQMRDGICNSCLKQGDEIVCSRCGNSFLFSNYQKHIKKSKPYTICYDCFKDMETSFSSRVCVDCGKTFTITVGEKEYFESKGFELPKRCSKCRKAKKTTNSNSTAGYQSTAAYTTASGQSSNGELSIGGLFKKIFSIFD